MEFKILGAFLLSYVDSKQNLFFGVMLVSNKGHK